MKDCLEYLKRLFFSKSITLNDLKLVLFLLLFFFRDNEAKVGKWSLISATMTPVFFILSKQSFRKILSIKVAE